MRSSRKSEARNPKPETIRPKSQSRKQRRGQPRMRADPGGWAVSDFPLPSFGFVSDFEIPRPRMDGLGFSASVIRGCFGFRNSDFEFPRPHRGEAGNILGAAKSF